MGAVSKVGMYQSGVSVEHEVNLSDGLIGGDANHGCDRGMREALKDVARG